MSGGQMKIAIDLFLVQKYAPCIYQPPLLNLFWPKSNFSESGRLDKGDKGALAQIGAKRS